MKTGDDRGSRNGRNTIRIGAGNGSDEQAGGAEVERRPRRAFGGADPPDECDRPDGLGDDDRDRKPILIGTRRCRDRPRPRDGIRRRARAAGTRSTGDRDRRLVPDAGLGPIRRPRFRRVGPRLAATRGLDRRFAATTPVPSHRTGRGIPRQPWHQRHRHCEEDQRPGVKANRHHGDHVIEIAQILTRPIIEAIRSLTTTGVGKAPKSHNRRGRWKDWFRKFGGVGCAGGTCGASNGRGGSR